MSAVTRCPICGREVAGRDEVRWAVVEVREAVKLFPHEFVPQEFVVHMECLRTKPLLPEETP